uniref:Uncharacterized protein n=1 Tax=Aegilops tauschii subsp. strangulata TaxID=200361 RepID=A0A453J5V2_AEGTS
IVGMEKKLPLPVVHGEGLWARPWRWAKTAFFLVSMLASLLLVCAPPLLIVLLDLLLPPALLSNFLRADAHQHAASAHTLLDQARGFHFRSSLVDLPAVSAARSLLILCKRPALPLRARTRRAAAARPTCGWRRPAASAPSSTSSPRPSRSSACRPTAPPASSCTARASSSPWRPCSSCRWRSPPRTSPWPTGPAAARSAGSTSSTGSTSKQ